MDTKKLLTYIMEHGFNCWVHPWGEIMVEIPVSHGGETWTRTCSCEPTYAAVRELLGY